MKTTSESRGGYFSFVAGEEADFDRVLAHGFTVVTRGTANNVHVRIDEFVTVLATRTEIQQNNLTTIRIFH